MLAQQVGEPIANGIVTFHLEISIPLPRVVQVLGSDIADSFRHTWAVTEGSSLTRNYYNVWPSKDHQVTSDVSTLDFVSSPSKTCGRNQRLQWCVLDPRHSVFDYVDRRSFHRAPCEIFFSSLLTRKHISNPCVESLDAKVLVSLLFQIASPDIKWDNQYIWRHHSRITSLQ